MIEVSNTVWIGYLVIGFILGLFVTTFVMEDDDLMDKSMILIMIMLLWAAALVVGGGLLFFAGAVKGADWLKVVLTAYFAENRQKS